MTIYNPKPAITDGLFVYELRLTKSFQAKTHLASDKFEPTAHAPELLEGFSFSARGTRVNRPWHIGSEIITALYNRFYRKNKFYFPLLSSS